jgi:hypothetical protein
MNDLFYLYGFIYIALRLYRICKKFVKRDFVMVTIDEAYEYAMAPPEEKPATLKHNTTASIIMLLSTAWVFMGYFSPESIYFWFITTISLLYFYGRFTRKAAGKEFLLWAITYLLEAFVAGVIIYKHFIAV